MKSIQLSDAQTDLSTLVEAAERGEPTTIVRFGRPAAMIVPMDDGARIYAPEPARSFADFLLSFPGGVEFERSDDPLRAIEP